MSELKENLKFQLIQKKQTKQNKKLSAKKPSKWLYPLGIEKQYYKLIKNIMNQFLEITNNKIKSNVGFWKEENKNITGIDSYNWEPKNPNEILTDILRSDKIMRGIYDSPADDLEEIDNEFIQLQNRLYGEDDQTLKNILTPIAISIFIFNDKQFQKVLSSGLGIDSFLVREQWRLEVIKQWVNQNVNLITGLTNEYRKKINTTVLRSFQQNETVSTLKNKLININREYATGKPTKIFKLKNGKRLIYKTEKIRNSVKIQNKIAELKKNGQIILETRGSTQSRSELIARDQTSKLNSQISRKRQQEVGVNIYQWQDANDERVRATHKPLDQKYCKLDDATVYADTLQDALDGKWKSRSSIGAVELHYGVDFQCRCWGSPVFNDIIKEVNNE